MESARAICDAVVVNGRCLLHEHDRLAANFREMDREMREWYARWSELVSYFYDGRIYSLHEAGAKMRQAHPNAIQRKLDCLVSSHIARMTAGATTRSGRSQWLLRMAARFLAWGVPPPDALAIR